MIQDPAKVDRLPPHATDSEQGILGCILLSPAEVLGECIPRFKDPEVFYDLRHRSIYEALVEMYDGKQAIDLITLMQRLKDKQQLEAVGGLAYLSSLPDAVPSAAHLEYYIAIVNDHYTRRKLIQESTAIIASAYEDGDSRKLLDKAEKAIFAIGQRQCGEDSTMKELTLDSINTIEQYHQNKGQLNGIKTGLHDFDKMTDGLHDGDLIIIAGRPSGGKSTLLMNIAEYVAVDQGKAAGYFSIETTKEQLSMRLLCSRARVDLRKIRDGFIAERDFPKLTGAAGQISRSPLYIDDHTNTLLEIRAKARRWKLKYDIKLLVVDYLQRVHCSSGKENRNQEVAEVSDGLKSLAKELGIPVLVACQMNRAIEKDKKRKPRLSDLRESGDIEADADVVGLLYSDQDEDVAEASSTNLLLAKQRNGPTGNIPLIFLKSITRIESAAKISNNDIPYTPTPKYENDEFPM